MVLPHFGVKGLATKRNRR